MIFRKPQHLMIAMYGAGMIGTAALGMWEACAAGFLGLTIGYFMSKGR